MTPPARHLLTLWNPSYSDDVLDTHLRGAVVGIACEGPIERLVRARMRCG